MLTSAPYNINLGGGEYVASNGEVYAADQAYVAGDFGYQGQTITRNFTNGSVAGTVDDAFYLSMRGGLNFSYSFDDLDPGPHKVVLHFVEPVNFMPGERMFDITMEGNIVAANFDIVAAAGGIRTAHQQSFNVNVIDGQLNVELQSTTGNIAILSGISVKEQGPAPTSTFVDVAADVGLVQSHDLGEICNPPIGSGSAWADFDADGDLDLFVTNRGGANRLYRQEPDANADGLPEFVDVAGSLAVDDPTGAGHSVVFIDYDNDGDQDIYLTNWGGNILFQNQLAQNGTVSFVDVTSNAGVADNGRAITSAWADFDQDGFLDFYVAKHWYCGTEPDPHDDRLYHNNGDGTFTNVSEYLGSAKLDGLGFAPGWLDFDNDGDQDLYLVNDNIESAHLPNVLWRNDGPDGSGGWLFTDISTASNSEISLNGMGLGVGDYDNNGYLDLAFSNVGENYLLRNDGNGQFSDVSASAGIQRATLPAGQQSITWGTAFFDYNNDQFLDLHIVAGEIGQSAVAQTNILFENNQDGTFSDVSAGSGLDDAGRGRSASIADFDKDGFVDVFLGNYGESPRLFHNKSSALGNSNQSLVITVEGTQSNRDAIGTRLQLAARGLRQRRDISSGPTHGGGDHRAAYFGLGSATSGSLRVRWPNGIMQNIGVVTPGHLHLVEPNSVSSPAPVVLQMLAAESATSHDELDGVRNVSRQVINLSTSTQAPIIDEFVGDAVQPSRYQSKRVEALDAAFTSLSSPDRHMSIALEIASLDHDKWSPF